MKVELQPKDTDTQTYPYLGHFKDFDGEYIVLFTKPRSGMVVYSTYKTINLGEYYEDKWREEEDFFPLSEGRRVTLMN